MRVLIAIGSILLGFLSLVGLSMLYEVIRVKLNKPRIGFKPLFHTLLKHDDYICIAGNVRRFSHWARSGEIIDVLKPPLEANKLIYDDDLACYNPMSLGYQYYSIDSLNDLQFVYGKYGVKWAKSKSWAEKAPELVEKYYE